jgi:predicted Zn-dependent protease
MTPGSSGSADRLPQDIVDRALDLSRTDGCIVIVHDGSGANLRWAGNTLTTNGTTRNRSVSVIATVGQGGAASSGVVTRSSAGGDELEELVREAEAAARAAEPAQDAADLLGPGEAYDGTGWDEPSEFTSPAVFSAFAPALGEVLRRASGQGRELFGFAEHDLATTYLGSSSGVRLRHVQPTGRVEVTGKSHARSRSTYVGRPTRDFTDVDVYALEAELVRRLGWQERRIELDPGRYDTILPPSALADLMVYLYWSASAREAHDGRTVFSKPGGGTRVGERLTEVPLELWSDPGEPAMSCEPFMIASASGAVTSVFDNGLPVSRTSWIKDGNLAALLQTRASAARTGLPLTPAVDNLGLSVPGADGSTDDLVAGTTGRVLLLTCLWYIREVDPQTLLLTGLTRDGVHVVDDGEVIGTATNFRFNESPVDLLRRVEAASATDPCLPREWADYFTRCSMPAVRVSGFNMSTVSPAN